MNAGMHYTIVQVCLIVAILVILNLFRLGNHDIRHDPWFLPVFLVLLWTSTIYKSHRS
jgi:hypothetical protein